MGIQLRKLIEGDTVRNIQGIYGKVFELSKNHASVMFDDCGIVIYKVSIKEYEFLWKNIEMVLY